MCEFLRDYFLLKGAEQPGGSDQQVILVENGEELFV